MFKLNDQIYYVEYNGVQHYRPVKFGSQTNEEINEAFRRQQIRDKWLRKYCKDNNIILIELDGRRLYGYEKISNYLTKKCKKLGIV